MKNGQKIGLTDQLLRDICVGDLVADAKGVQYTIDRYGRAKPLDGGNEVPVRSLTGCEVALPYGSEPPAPERDPEQEAIHQMYEAVDAACDQMLVDKLRERGWNVVCTKMVEKVVYEEVAL